MTPHRVLPSPDLYGSRDLRVDGQGNGDYPTIQSAIDAAQAAEPPPSAARRWLVRIAPGEYQEALRLSDYIDVAGIAPGYPPYIVSPASQPAFLNAAECTIADLRIGGSYDYILSTGAGFTGTLRLVNLVADDLTTPEKALLRISSGTVLLRNCWFRWGGMVAYLLGGSLLAYHSVLEHSHTDGGAASEPVLYTPAACTLRLHHCQVENNAPAGAAILLAHASADLKASHCTFRKASGTYAIAATTSLSAALAGCAGNAALDPLIGGYADYVYDSTI